MSQERNLDQTVTVSRGDVTVEKAFEPDEFPVPAVTFRIESSDSDPVDLRLVDEIPEEFPMSAIGFHPEFESDSWSAYKDHRVVFERTLEPGEEVRTVYGVRLDREEDAVAFLTRPALEGIDESDESVEDILGEDRNQAVRDVLAGDRDSLVDDGQSEDSVSPDASDDERTEDFGDLDDPGDERTEDSVSLDASGDERTEDSEGLGDPDGERDGPEIELEDPTGSDGAQPASSEANAPSPRTFTGEGSAAVEELAPDATIGAQPEVTATGGSEDESGPGIDLDDTDVADSESAESRSTTESEPTTEPASTTGSAPTVATGAGGGVAEALAREIRNGDVADEDLELLRDELDLGVPRSVDVRIQRLQRTVADLDAYADALEEFIDEEGTAEELVDSFRGDVESLSETVTDLESDLAATGEDVETLRSDLSATDRRLEAVDEDVLDVRADVEDVSAELDTVSDEVDRVTDEIEHVTEEVGDVTDEVESLREDFDQEIDDVERRLEATADDIETTLSEELDDVRTEVDRTVEDIRAETEANGERITSLEAEFREFESFRERLEQAFGGMSGVDDPSDGA